MREASMRKKWLFLLFFFIFFAVIISEARFYPASERSFVEFSGDRDSFDEFSKEIISFLAEVLPDKKTFDEVCDVTYLREDVYYDEILITLYLVTKDKNNKNIIIWSGEIEEMKTPEAIRDSAQDAAYLLLKRLGRDLPIATAPTAPIIKPSAKRITL